MFDWKLDQTIRQTSIFLQADITSRQCIGRAMQRLHPDGVDVSSGIETDGNKGSEKMAAFVAAVRKEGKYDKSKWTLRHSRWTVYS
ncbi:hypothetical protein [Hominenteromicrobium sp.]|uniref:phosphoribosylanthranilate isomerase n=1 Tax=Hominenteromicrobium sp. TaxID=3073581 RepID=UPI00399ACF26